MRKARRQVIRPVSKEQRLRALQAVWDALEDADEDDVLGALTLPWRRPRCVFGLLIELAEVPNGAPDDLLSQALKVVRSAFDADHDGVELAPAVYDRVHDLRYELTRTSPVDLPKAGERARLGMIAALECVGKWMARSDGGGHVYNAYATPFCHYLLWTNASTHDRLMQQVERWRFRDVFGFGHESEGALVQAFRAAWVSGRYELAYLLAGRRR